MTAIHNREGKGEERRGKDRREGGRERRGSERERGPGTDDDHLHFYIQGVWCRERVGRGEERCCIGHGMRRQVGEVDW